MKRIVAGHNFINYWTGLVSSAGHITFRVHDKYTEKQTLRHVYTISPLSVGFPNRSKTPGEQELYVAIRTFKIAEKGYRINGSDRFVGEYRVPIGSYVDVVNTVAQKEGYEKEEVQYV
tara:strand:- start:498 stop:851 length:354 start_codon:yes stop_codon:yes gene_type:complete